MKAPSWGSVSYTKNHDYFSLILHTLYGQSRRIWGYKCQSSTLGGNFNSKKHTNQIMNFQNIQCLMQIRPKEKKQTLQYFSIFCFHATWCCRLGKFNINIHSIYTSSYLCIKSGKFETRLINPPPPSRHSSQSPPGCFWPREGIESWN